MAEKKNEKSISRGDLKDRARVAIWTTVFGGAGVLHFAAHQLFDPLVPEQLPGEQRYWTWGSGALELALAAAIANPGTRARAALPAAVFLAGVLPGNVKMALDWQKDSQNDSRKSPLLAAGAWLRVAGQLPMIGSVLRLR